MDQHGRRGHTTSAGDDERTICLLHSSAKRIFRSVAGGGKRTNPPQLGTRSHHQRRRIPQLTTKMSSEGACLPHQFFCYSVFLSHNYQQDEPNRAAGGSKGPCWGGVPSLRRLSAGNTCGQRDHIRGGWVWVTTSLGFLGSCCPGVRALGADGLNGRRTLRLSRGRFAEADCA